MVQQTDNVVSKLIPKINCLEDLHFSKDHEVEASYFNCSDRLLYRKYPAVADVEGSDGDPRWSLGPTARRRRRQVGTIGTISDRSGEGNKHPTAVVEVGTVPSKISPVVACIFSTAVWICIYMEATPVTRKFWGRSRDAVSANTNQ